MTQIYCLGGPHDGQPYNMVRRRTEGYAPIDAPLYSLHQIEGEGRHAGESRTFAVIAGMDEDEARERAAVLWNVVASAGNQPE